ncbi:hypothetical protein RhiirA1_535783 [Rhizophagus irregularis]|uniref:Phytocyanin domain-containing protein n=1 Tax=Rhizophagus irregularis TaxID=588596 RepID=A0A2N0RSE5_9GLOM|nr:hypothetical protein RhiirA1_535783 [Rhizophagus irregularis]
MNKTLSIYLFLLGIIIYAYAADIMVEVGGPKGKNAFIPNVVLATVGDNIVFTWKTGKHSIIESDAAKICSMSSRSDAFTSGGAFMAPKQWTLPVDVAGKRRFYCGVPGHCTPGFGGMEGTLIIRNPNAPGKTGPGKAGKVSSDGINGPDNKNTDNKASTIGAIIGGLFGGILLTIGSVFLYKRNKTNKDKMLVPEDNRNNQDVILIPGNYVMSENNNEYHGDSNIEVYNEQEANQSNNGREESISISKNNDTSGLKKLYYLKRI